VTRVGVAAMAVAAVGIAVSVTGRHLGRPFLETAVGPAVTLLGALLWVVFRAKKRRRR